MYYFIIIEFWCDGWIWFLRLAVPNEQDFTLFLPKEFDSAKK